MSEEKKASSDRSYFKELYEIPDYQYSTSDSQPSEDIEDVLRSFGRQARNIQQAETSVPEEAPQAPPQAPQLQHTVEKIWDEEPTPPPPAEESFGELLTADGNDEASMDDIYAVLGNEVRRENRFDSIEQRFDFDTEKEIEKEKRQKRRLKEKQRKARRELANAGLQGGFEYTEKSQAKQLRSQLREYVFEARLRTWVMTFLSLLSLYLSLSPVFNLPIPVRLSAVHNPTLWLLASTVLLAAAGILCAHTLCGGAVSLVRLSGNTDALCLSAFLAAAVEHIALFWHTDLIVQGRMFLFTPLVLLILTADSIAAHRAMLRERLSFLVATPPTEPLYALLPVRDEHTIAQLTDEEFAEEALLCAACQTEHPEKFFSHSSASGRDQAVNNIQVPASVLLTVAATVIYGFVKKDWLGALSCWCVLSIACCPLAIFFAAELPLFRAVKSLFRRGSTLLGHHAYENLADMGAVVLRDDELLGRNGVMISGLKVLGNHLLNEVMTDILSLFNASGGAIFHAFEAAIKGAESELRPVEKFIFYPEKGIAGAVGGREIFIGSPQFCRENGIRVPELNLPSGAKDKLMMCVGYRGSLAAVFAVRYTLTSQAREALELCEREDVQLLISTTDPNLTDELLQRLYGHPLRCVHIVGRNGSQEAARACAPRRSTEAPVYAKGNPLALLWAACSCCRVKATVFCGLLLQIAAAVFSVLLGLLLVFKNDFAQLSTLNLLILQLAWFVPVGLLSCLRRY